jgi:hypothetical protein
MITFILDRINMMVVPVKKIKKYKKEKARHDGACLSSQQPGG